MLFFCGGRTAENRATRVAVSAADGGMSRVLPASYFKRVGRRLVGRLLIDPTGKLETAIEAEKVFGGTSPKDSRRGFVIGRRFHRRLRDPRFARSVATLVAVEGQRLPTGWLVLAGDAA